MAYEVGTTDAHTTADRSLCGKARRLPGPCPHHDCAGARAIGLPARYVTGYLVTGIGASSTAAHAWAELLVPDLGWVGFDAANGQCPTDHYVRAGGRARCGGRGPGPRHRGAAAGQRADDG